MALESPTYINDLVSTNPASGDPVSQGDDHIRNLKAVLRASFPGLSEALLDGDGRIKASFLGGFMNRNGERLEANWLIPEDVSGAAGRDALSVTITPSSATAKIRVAICIVFDENSLGADSAIVSSRIWRGTGSIPTITPAARVLGDIDVTVNDDDTLQHEPIDVFTVHSPASTAEQTYNIRCTKADGGGVVSLGVGTCIIVEEL